MCRRCIRAECVYKQADQSLWTLGVPVCISLCPCTQVWTFSGQAVCVRRSAQTHDAQGTHTARAHFVRRQTWKTWTQPLAPRRRAHLAPSPSPGDRAAAGWWVGLESMRPACLRTTGQQLGGGSGSRARALLAYAPQGSSWVVGRAREHAPCLLAHHRAAAGWWVGLESMRSACLHTTGRQLGGGSGSRACALLACTPQGGSWVVGRAREHPPCLHAHYCV